VGELVEDGDADLLLELGRLVAELRLERAAVDGDPGRQELLLLEEAEEIRLVRVLVLDDDGDVLQGGRDPRRQRVERVADVLIERRHQ